MNPATTRSFTAGRIVALALIGLVVLGLGYLRFSPDDGVAVPKGAHAGQLTMRSCTYSTEQGGYAADCGTLVVPENSADPQSRLIAVPVTRIKARSAHPAEPVFRLEGGPGGTNMNFAKASRFAEHRDVVLVGYRGVDGSVRLDCPEVESALKRSNDYLSQKTTDDHADALRDCAARLTHDGVDLRGYGQVQQADDLEAARTALGYGRVDLVSESAGTRTAMIYAWRYPQAVHRSVMIGVNPPGHYVWDAKTTDEQIRRYAKACAQDDTCHRRTQDLAETLKLTDGDLPDSWLGLPIKQGQARVASFYGLMETTSESAPLSAPMTIDTWLSAANGDASGLWFQSLLAELAFPDSVVWGQFSAAGHADAAAAKRYFASRGANRDSAILGSPGADFIWAKGKMADAWPATVEERNYDHVRPSNVETLMIGGALDVATPPQYATKDLLPKLPNGHQVVLEGFGHSTSVWTDQQEAGTHLINTFFDTGKVDTSRYKPQKVDFTPEVTQTALAKGIAGAMAGLAALTILSLLLMPLVVWRRGRFGRKASVTLRALYPVVLGFGGWFLGLLIVMTTMEGTPLDSPALAVISVGAPVGLGLYWSWVSADRSRGAKLAGFAAAVGGALAGAWLGFHAAEDLLALLTTIAGAAAFGNLALVVLDIAGGRQPRVAESHDAAPEARPVIG